MAWVPIFVLPNVNAEHSIETGKIALTSAFDERLEGYEHKIAFKGFLTKFENQHGNQIAPSVIWWNESSQDDKPDIEAICSFRDIVALSFLLYHRTKVIVGAEQFSYFLYAEYFAFYPWMLERDGSYLVYQVPDAYGAHELASFKGQSTAGITYRKLGNEYDFPILTALLGRWKAVWEDPTPSWRHIVLFRSLNMAFAACQMPSGTQPTTFYDNGRIAALWVSAFEILSRKDKTAKVGPEDVWDLLERSPNYGEATANKRYTVNFRGTNIPVNLSGFLYNELYKTRNDFLHGNQVTRDRLLVQPCQRTILAFTAPLYRLALSAFLELTWENYKEFMRSEYSDQFWFNMPQWSAEGAILASQKTPKASQRL